MREQDYWIDQQLKELRALLIDIPWEYLPRQWHPNRGLFLAREGPGERTEAIVFHSEKCSTWISLIFGKRAVLTAKGEEPWRALHQALYAAGEGD